MEKLKEYLPLATVIVIVLGYLDIFFYYHHFDIDIHNYLTVSEIIFSFSFVLVAVFCAILYCLIHYGDKFALEKRAVITSAKGQITLKRVSAKTFFTCLGLIMLAYTFGMLGMEGIIPLNNFPELQTIGFLFLGLFIPLFFMYKPLIVSSITARSQSFKLILIFVTILVLYLFLINSIKSAHIDKGFPKFDVELTRRDQPPIKTNKNFVYLGATSNYFFFKSILTKKFVVIPKSEVTEVRQVRIRKGL